MEELSDWLDEWELHLGGTDLDPESIVVYVRSVRQLIGWLGSAHPTVVSWGQCTTKHCTGWMAHLKALGRAESTRRVRCIALGRFLDYVAGEPDSGLDHNPAKGLELPVPKEKPVPVVPDEDIVALLGTASGNAFIPRRDKAIIRMLFDAGVRRAELVGIDVDDLDLRHQEVLVHGKGGKDRIVPFGSRTTLALRKYLRVRATRPPADAPALFLSTRPSARGSWRLTGGAVGEMIDRRCEMAGLTHRYPHMFRHTWAADLKAAGVHDDYLERLAGWSTPTMSRRYGNAVADRQAREASRRLARGDRV